GSEAPGRQTIADAVTLGPSPSAGVESGREVEEEKPLCLTGGGEEIFSRPHARRNRVRVRVREAKDSNDDARSVEQGRRDGGGAAVGTTCGDQAKPPPPPRSILGVEDPQGESAPNPGAVEDEGAFFSFPGMEGRRSPPSGEVEGPVAAAAAALAPGYLASGEVGTEMAGDWGHVSWSGRGAAPVATTPCHLLSTSSHPSPAYLCPSSATTEAAVASAGRGGEKVAVGGARGDEGGNTSLQRGERNAKRGASCATGHVSASGMGAASVGGG
ncbi:unnamed protein product, partial [Discosporangium mesarthrocarpum]